MGTGTAEGDEIDGTQARTERNKGPKDGGGDGRSSGRGMVQVGDGRARGRSQPRARGLNVAARREKLLARVMVKQTGQVEEAGEGKETGRAMVLRSWLEHQGEEFGSWRRPCIIRQHSLGLPC